MSNIYILEQDIKDIINSDKNTFDKVNDIADLIRDEFTGYYFEEEWKIEDYARNKLSMTYGHKYEFDSTEEIFDFIRNR